jgi:AraC-like DNA-binding protein
MTREPYGRLTPPVVVDRKVAVQRARAREWFEARGLRVVRSSALQVFADSLRSPGFGITRIWHAPVETERIADEPGALRDGLVLVLGIEGSTVLGFADSPSIVVRPGGWATFPSSARWTVGSQAPVARLEIHFDGRVLGDGLLDVHRRGVVGTTTSPYGDVLVSAANAILSSDVDPSGAPFVSLRIGLENLVASFLTSSGPTASLPGTAASSVYDRAVELIASECRSPDLTVAGLARSLSVTERYLQLAFAQAGTRPLREIRRARARLASEYMRSGTYRALGADAVAELAGFRTARSMRLAVQELAG